MRCGLISCTPLPCSICRIAHRRTKPGGLVMGNRLPVDASKLDADPDTAAEQVRPTEERASVRPDAIHPSRRNRLLASLPNEDLTLLRPHLKEVLLEQGAIL